MQDLRPVYYHENRLRLVGNRLLVFNALKEHGPCTCAELAQAMDWEVTSVRPRITELRKMDAAIETGIRRNGEHEVRAMAVIPVEEPVPDFILEPCHA